MHLAVNHKSQKNHINLSDLFRERKPLHKPTKPSQQLEHNKFSIEPELLGKISKLGFGKPIEKRIDIILKELKKTYPDLVFSENPKWYNTSMNGEILQYANLFASKDEFITIVHHPFRCPCFTGRFKGIDIYSAVIDGNIKACSPGELKPKVYRRGDVYSLKQGEAKSVEFDKGTLMLDYYRGNTLSILPYATLLPTLFQNGDFIGCWEQIKDSFDLVLKNESKKAKKSN